jgi:hypothetical protein
MYYMNMYKGVSDVTDSVYALSWKVNNFTCSLKIKYPLFIAELCSVCNTPTALSFINYIFPHTVFRRFLLFSEQTAISLQNAVKGMVFVIETEIIVKWSSCFKGLKSQTNSLLQILSSSHRYLFVLILFII